MPRDPRSQSHPTPAQASHASEARTGLHKRRGELVAGALAGTLAIGAGVTFLALRSADSMNGGRIEGVKTWQNLSREHVVGSPTYAMTPPVGGNHNAAWANCGVYTEPVPNKYAVHSLEHGAVWITYSSKASEADIKRLQSLGRQKFVLMSPYPNQPSPITLSAWGTQLDVSTATDERITKFIKKYRQGPQTPEPGAPCTGSYDPNSGSILTQMRPPG